MPLDPSNDNSNINILVAEDEAVQRSFLEVVLSTVGYSITLVRNGKEALEHLRDHTPDLIILDINMPYMSGIEICSRVKAVRRLRHVPVIILTAQDDARTETTATFSKADAFVGKPFKNAHLVAVVEDLLEKSPLA